MTASWRSNTNIFNGLGLRQFIEHVKYLGMIHKMFPLNQKSCSVILILDS